MKEKTDRELSLQWWRELSPVEREEFTSIHFEKRSLSSLTGREIEEIWNIENNLF